MTGLPSPAAHPGKPRPQRESPEAARGGEQEASRDGGRRSGRRGGGSSTREAILAAARRRFADHGYDGATIRAIAADAGVDAALVHHFYGSKERLFGAAMELPVVPGEVIAAALAEAATEPGRTLGEHLVGTALRMWDAPEIQSTFLGLLRSAVTSPRAATMLREFIASSILVHFASAAQPGAAQPGGAATVAGKPAGGGRATVGGHSDYRAALVASQMLGLALARYVLEIEPVASASAGDLAAAVGPTIERYLAGDL